MDYMIENDFIRVTVTTHGAQVKSVVRKQDGVEHIWCGDPEVWGFHAPVLFPHCGKVVDGIIEAKGMRCESPIHGFLRFFEQELVEHTEGSLVLELCSNEETWKHFPYNFKLQSIFTLEENTLNHTIHVENLDEDEMPFTVGYHPGFAIPFDNNHVATDYELRFSEMESPMCVNNNPSGLTYQDHYYFPANIRSIPVDDQLFANGSHCMVNLRSETLGLYEKDTGRGVVCSLEGFPYTLLWSKSGTPKFVCIEPWHGLPSRVDISSKWEEKSHGCILAPCDSWDTTLSMSFVR